MFQPKRAGLLSSLALSLLAIAVLLPAAQAEITMTVDTAAKTFTLSGSATGIPQPTGAGGMYSEGTVVWSVPGGAGTQEVSASGAFSVTPGTLARDPRLRFGFGTIGLGCDVIGNGPDPATQPQTLTATGTFSYAGLNAANQAGLESLIGSEMPLANGSGFGPLKVVAPAPPPTPADPPVIVAPETIRPRDASCTDPLITVTPPDPAGTLTVIVEPWFLNGAGQPVDKSWSAEWVVGEPDATTGVVPVYICDSGGVGTVFFVIAEYTAPTGEKSVAVSITEVVRK